jgi:hypothetical protein
MSHHPRACDDQGAKSATPGMRASCSDIGAGRADVVTAGGELGDVLVRQPDFVICGIAV